MNFLRQFLEEHTGKASMTRLSILLFTLSAMQIVWAIVKLVDGVTVAWAANGKPDGAAGIISALAGALTALVGGGVVALSQRSRNPDERHEEEHHA